MVGCQDPPIGAGPYRNQLPVYPSVFKQVLLNRYPTLFLVEIRAGLSAPKLYVEVSDSFIKNTAPECRFDFPVPHGLWVEMEILAKSACQDDAASEFVSKLGRYG